MSFSDYLFYLVSAIILVSTAAAVFSVKAATALKAAAIAMVTLTILFFYLDADYIAFMHLIIFTFGALGMITFAFLKTKALTEAIERGGSAIYVMTGAIFAALLAGTLVANKWPENAPERSGLNTGEIAGLINSEYLLPLLVTALILFLGILGTSFKTRKN
jgi:NADH:ubiquinone oxidoreductase subunit 6 (subunit J)